MGGLDGTRNGGSQEVAALEAVATGHRDQTLRMRQGAAGRNSPWGGPRPRRSPAPHWHAMDHSGGTPAPTGMAREAPASGMTSDRSGVSLMPYIRDRCASAHPGGAAGLSEHMRHNTLGESYQKGYTRDRMHTEWSRSDRASVQSGIWIVKAVSRAGADHWVCFERASR